MYLSFFKRLLDLFIAIIALIILSPIFILLTVILFFLNEGKPFFLHERPGKDERLFWLIKFKSMNDKTDENGELLPFHLRVTPFGRFIRKYSLDEIPQLLNVLKGDMSVIGPRPLLTEYLPLYNEEQRHRHDLKPGITGWAQVNGRNAIPWPEKFALDLWYVEHVSFLTDVRILLMTFEKVLLNKDVNSSSDLNMEHFKGGN